MNSNKIQTLKRDIAKLRRRFDLAEAEVKNLDRGRSNAQRAVTILGHNPANTDKIENAKRELQNQQKDYDSASSNYYSILGQIQRKNIELQQEESTSVNLGKAFRR